MGLLAIPLLFLIYWVIDIIQENNRNKDYKKYEERQKEMGLK